MAHVRITIASTPAHISPSLVPNIIYSIPIALNPSCEESPPACFLLPITDPACSEGTKLEPQRAEGTNLELECAEGTEPEPEPERSEGTEPERPPPSPQERRPRPQWMWEHRASLTWLSLPSSTIKK